MIGLVAAIRRLKDERRRTRKRLPELEAADLVLVSHAKSGRTWLVALVSHVLHRTHGVPADELLEGDNFHRLDPAIPRVFATHERNEPAAVRRRLPTAVHGKRLLLMVRDPRDVIVSWYHHHAKRSTERTRARLGLPLDMAGVDLARFVTAPDYGLASVLAFLDRWVAIAGAHPDALIVRYEDLRARTVEELARVMGFLRLPAPADALEAARDFAALEALRERERTGFYRTDRLQARDPSDPASFKVRRGKVGGYRDELPAETVALLDRMVAERLDPALGYATATPAGSRRAAIM